MHQPAQKRPQFAIRNRPQHEMPMIGHETITEHAGRLFQQRFAQNALECLVVAVLLEQRQTRHTPVKGMVDEAAGGNTRVTRHAT